MPARSEKVIFKLSVHLCYLLERLKTLQIETSGDNQEVKTDKNKVGPKLVLHGKDETSQITNLTRNMDWQKRMRMAFQKWNS